MPGTFDSKFFNAEVFGRYIERAPRVRQNALLKAGVLRTRNDLAAMLGAQTGGNIVTTPMFGVIGGDALNYDGVVDVTASTTAAYKQTHVVVGRMKGWTEKDFSSDLAGGTDFMANIAAQVNDYWDGVDFDTMIAILKGIFAASTDLKTYHQTDITAAATPTVGAATLNSAIQKACGDNKNIFRAAIMHSAVATNLENANLLDYMKYTDAQGIQRDLGLATWNGRTVFVDDNVGVENGYYTATSTTPGALEVVATGASTGEVNLATVTGSDFYPAGVAADDYVLPGVKYHTYILGEGAFDFANCGAKVPYEMWRDPKTDGGLDWLISRQRKIFTPYGMSWTSTSMSSSSPTAAELATSSNWVIAPDTAGSGHIDHKAIPICEIISQG